MCCLQNEPVTLRYLGTESIAIEIPKYFHPTGCKLSILLEISHLLYLDLFLLSQ